MDQRKVGRFLKELRKEKSVTQEQLAEILGVSNRSISRWENGATMPDFDLLFLIAEYFEVEIGEILNGERKEIDMDIQTEETLRKVTDYHNTEKEFFSKKICGVFIAGIVGMFIYMVIDLLGLTAVQPYESIVNVALGLVLGDLLVGALYSSRYIAKVKAAKMRLLHRVK